MSDKRIKIGKVVVDSGQLVICDPCYINHKGRNKELNDYDRLLIKRGIVEKMADTTIGKLYRKLPIDKRYKKYTQLNYDMGHEGLGVVFDSGVGDGTYEVFAEIGKVKGMGTRVKKVEIILV